MSGTSSGAARFDAAYYRRFYHDPRTRVAGASDAARLADMVRGLLRYYRVPVRRVVDVGCGTGLLLRALQRRWPRAHCVGVEHSDWAARRYGWQRGSVETFSDRHGFDLVVCNDVLQYLDDGAARRAIDNLSALCRGALLFGVMTRRDYDELADRELSDAVGRFRTGSWYRRALSRDFEGVGSGVFLKRELLRPVWELEGS